MGKRAPQRLGFEIDKLTNSIEDVKTGAVLETKVSRLFTTDTKRIVPRRWQFDWRLEIKSDDREVYALTSIDDPKTLQGLISFAYMEDHIFMHLVESAPSNIGKAKKYAGVAANLVAFACHCSFMKGFGGAVVFVSKTRLMEHYENKLGAKRIGGNRMFIDTDEADRLVRRYHNSF